MATDIPTWSRRAVREREKDRCARCGAPIKAGHWHHRRSRRVRDEHQHHPCNGVLLCGTCHTWVHANPFLARKSGFIVSAHEPEPGKIPVDTVWGLRSHLCDGTFLFTE